MKNQYREVDCLKRGGLGQFAYLSIFQGGFGKKEGDSVFEGVGGGLIPQCIPCHPKTNSCHPRHAWS